MPRSFDPAVRTVKGAAGVIGAAGVSEIPSPTVGGTDVIWTGWGACAGLVVVRSSLSADSATSCGTLRGSALAEGVGSAARATPLELAKDSNKPSVTGPVDGFIASPPRFVPGAPWQRGGRGPPPPLPPVTP